ncbi:hypothetical protein [Actinomadura sp. WMMB 499]|uniref:hypothetical protein n=1 Tax=Actinomadura sp. WMMB 499 TaxID=1219491 RepID=UPI001246925A|nr:hypothetical protein [Actinomadura sp. WMMB 499]QFG22666.1 hypothetical protein F7P10_17620 [Actinomadura sp. WMMB 499]
MHERERLSPSGLPWPGTWTVRRLYGRARNVGFAAVGVLLIGCAFWLWSSAYYYEDLYMAGGMALAGLALVLSPLTLAIGRSRGAVSVGVRRVNGVRHHGAVFRVRWTFRLAGPVAVAGFGASTAAIAAATGPAALFDSIMLVAGAGLVLYAPVLFAGGLGFRGIVLTPDLVVVRASTHRAALCLPWSELDAVAAWEEPGKGGEGRPLLVLTVLDASHLRVRWWPRVKYRYFGVRDDDTVVHAGRFGADPALLLHALRHYLDHPGDRHELAGAKAIERLRAGDLHGADVPYGRPDARERRRRQGVQGRPVRRS